MKKNIIFILFIVIVLCGCNDKTTTSNVEPKNSVENEAPVRYVEPEVEEEFDPRDISLRSVDSTCFSRIGYDRYENVLVVEFESSGKRYAYYDFSEYDYSDFCDADSLGGYYNDYIKGRYPSERLD